MYSINGAMMLQMIRNLLRLKHGLDRHLDKKNIKKYVELVQFFHAKKVLNQKEDKNLMSQDLN